MPGLMVSPAESSPPWISSQLKQQVHISSENQATSSESSRFKNWLQGPRLEEHAQKFFLDRDAPSKQFGDELLYKNRHTLSLIWATYLYCRPQILHLGTPLSILSMCKHKQMLNKSLNTFVCATILAIALRVWLLQALPCLFWRLVSCC